MVKWLTLSSSPPPSAPPAEYPLLIRLGANYGKHGSKGVNVCEGGSGLETENKLPSYWSINIIDTVIMGEQGKCC